MLMIVNAIVRLKAGAGFVRPLGLVYRVVLATRDASTTEAADAAPRDAAAGARRDSRFQGRLARMARVVAYGDGGAGQK